MTQHAELIENARELAKTITGRICPGHPADPDLAMTAVRQTCQRASDTIDILANTVERQDKSIEELEAACVTCDEVMTYGLRHGSGHDPMWWTKFRAARHLARLAVKREKPEGETEKPTPPPDWDRYHRLLDLMTERDLSPSERAEYDRFLPIIATLDAVEGKAADAAQDNLVAGHERIIASIRRLTDAVEADTQSAMRVPTNAQLREWARRPDNEPPEWWWRATDDPFKPEPAPTIKVEMTARQTHNGWWLWQCRLGGTWSEPAIAEHQRRQVTEADARLNAEEWLAALSEQLGVPLEAAWKEGER